MSTGKFVTAAAKAVASKNKVRVRFFFSSVDVFSGEREHDTGKIETETDKVI